MMVTIHYDYHILLEYIRVDDIVISQIGLTIPNGKRQMGLYNLFLEIFQQRMPQRKHH